MSEFFKLPERLELPKLSPELEAAIDRALKPHPADVRNPPRVSRELRHEAREALGKMDDTISPVSLAQFQQWVLAIIAVGPELGEYENGEAFARICHRAFRYYPFGAFNEANQADGMRMLNRRLTGADIEELVKGDACQIRRMHNGLTRVFNSLTEFDERIPTPDGATDWRVTGPARARPSHYQPPPDSTPEDAERAAEQRRAIPQDGTMPTAFHGGGGGNAGDRLWEGVVNEKGELEIKPAETFTSATILVGGGPGNFRAPTVAEITAGADLRIDTHGNLIAADIKPNVAIAAREVIEQQDRALRDLAERIHDNPPGSIDLAAELAELYPPVVRPSIFGTVSMGGTMVFGPPQQEGETHTLTLDADGKLHWSKDEQR